MKKSLFIKKCVIVSFILLSMLNTGCWNRKELKELGVVGSVAIDTENDKVKLTYEIVLPKKLESSGAEEKAVMFFESEGESVLDAIRNSTLKFNRMLYWPHTNIIYLSEDCAKKGLSSYIDLFNRDHDLRKYIHMLIVKDMPASDIMNNEWQEGVIPSLYVETISENYVANGKTSAIKILDFLKAYYSQGIEPVIGAITITENSESDSGANSNSGGENQEDSEEKETDKLPLLEGLFVFKEDKLVGYLDGTQSKAYNIITNKIKNGVTVADSPDNKGITSLEIIKSSSSISVEQNEGKYTGNVSVNIHGIIGEETGKEDITNPETIKKIEKLTSETIKLQLEDCIKQVQKYKSDVFGFGKAFHIKKPEEWRKIKDNWNDIFANMDINVEVETVIEKVGVSDQQLRLKEQDLNEKN